MILIGIIVLLGLLAISGLVLLVHSTQDELAHTHGDLELTRDALLDTLDARRNA